MTETLSAGDARPAPSAQTPVHGISQTRLRSARERKLRPRMMRSSQRSGGCSGGAASSPRFACHCRVTGKTSSHQRRRMTAGYSRDELLIAAIARLLEGEGNVAVGSSSPIPAAAALLAQATSNGATRALVFRNSIQDPFRKARASSTTASVRAASTCSSSAVVRSTARPI